MKNSTDSVGNRTRNLPAYSAVLMLPSIVRFHLQTPCEVKASGRETKEAMDEVILRKSGLIDFSDFLVFLYIIVIIKTNEMHYF